MNKYLRKSVRYVVRFVNALFPKDEHKVMFASTPDFADNSRAVFDYMSQNDFFCDWKFVWVVSSDFHKPQLPRTIFVVRSGLFSMKNLCYYYHLFTSKYLFCTHSDFVEANPQRQVSVCLWHGTMLKRICAMNEREKNMPRKDQYRFFISPSVFYIEYFCRSFLCKRENVLVTGYPRNDYLFQETDILNKLHIDLTRGQKLIVYMPTFRTPIEGGYSDSDNNNPGCIDIDDEGSLLSLSDFLVKSNVILVVKWHPADNRQNHNFNKPNLLSINSKQMSELDLQVYHLLHYADALITDYSSVYCDYMMLDRPIAFDINDIESYSDNRGFVFDKPLDLLPGYIIKNESDLLEFINDVSNDVDKSKKKRVDLYHIYNDFEDSKSTERLMKRTIINYIYEK